MICPDCESSSIVKNGKNCSGKQNFMCESCKRRFIENPENKIISQAVKEPVDDPLLEKIPLAGIVRTAKV